MSEQARTVAERIVGGHYYCEDGWYTCPMHPEGSANDDAKGCNCGWERRVTEAESILTAYAAEIWEAAAREVDQMVSNAAGNALRSRAHAVSRQEQE